jgi:malonyl-CoA O-methyltransferase
VNRIAQRFDRAAPTYAQATPIQRQVVAALADRIAGCGLDPGARAAEFGCGTGYLPLAAWPRLQPSLWLATDIAPAMAAAAARALPPGGLAAVMDAARPALAPGFDLVCSSLTLQWLDDPAAAVAGWRAMVKSRGCLAVATMVEGGFVEWREALSAAGAAPPGPEFPSSGQVRSWFGPQTEIEILTLTQRYRTGLAFLRDARDAGVDAGNGRALDSGTMRRALRAFEANGASITYRIALVLERF